MLRYPPHYVNSLDPDIILASLCYMFGKTDSGVFWLIMSDALTCKLNPEFILLLRCRLSTSLQYVHLGQLDLRDNSCTRWIPNP